MSSIKQEGLIEHSTLSHYFVIYWKNLVFPLKQFITNKEENWMSWRTEEFVYISSDPNKRSITENVGKKCAEWKKNKISELILHISAIDIADQNKIYILWNSSIQLVDLCKRESSTIWGCKR